MKTCPQCTDEIPARQGPGRPAAVLRGRVPPRGNAGNQWLANEAAWLRARAEEAREKATARSGGRWPALAEQWDASAERLERQSSRHSNKPSPSDEAIGRAQRRRDSEHA